jgi:hypothetical protein
MTLIQARLEEPATLKWMADLARIAAEAIAREDTEWPIFHGSWDWHSAVHCHWMLLVHARVTGDRTHVEAVRASLGRPGGIAGERELLASSPAFEMPYGRAWLLRLATAYELDPAGDASLRPLADEVFESMERWYAGEGKGDLGPGRREYANASWALLQMLGWARHVGDAAAAGRVVGLVREHFAPETLGEIDFADDADPRAGFFSRKGNWIQLVVAALDEAESVRWLREAGVDGEELEPVARLFTDHHLGMNPSRASALAVLASRGDGAAAASWSRHLDAMMQAHARHAGQYRAYDHWVPSFCMHAIGLAASR